MSGVWCTMHYGLGCQLKLLYVMLCYVNVVAAFVVVVKTKCPSSNGAPRFANIWRAR